MRHALALTLTILPTVGLADYSGHTARQAFAAAPCGAFIAAIDLDEDALAAQIDLLDADSWEPLISAMTLEALYFGQILGLDAARGGLHTDTQTTLQRLRAACEDSPETPAFDLLDAMR